MQDNKWRVGMPPGRAAPASDDLSINTITAIVPPISAAMVLERSGGPTVVGQLFLILKLGSKPPLILGDGVSWEAVCHFGLCVQSSQKFLSKVQGCSGIRSHT